MPARSKPTSAPLRRTGLHRLECDRCDAYVYGTVASLERHGMPRCNCGGSFYPDHPELAMQLAPDSPAADEYRARIAAAWHGQAPNAARCGRTSDRLRAPETVALEGTSHRPGLLAERAQAARARRLSGLRRGPGAAVEPDEMPF